MSSLVENNKQLVPKSAIVIFNYGAFGGAPKRFTNLFLYLYKIFPENIYLIINSHLFNQIKDVYSKLPLNNIRIIDSKEYDGQKSRKRNSGAPVYYHDTIPDPLAVDKNTTLLRKIYWYFKNYYKQRLLFKHIETYRKELGIKVFMGVFSGILPLVFYINDSPRTAGVIFSDMDSWFSEVHSDMKRLWYRKYYSFNYALENSDCVDFLSPYVLEGVKKLGVNIKEENISISPCSFADYSKCIVGDKTAFEVAFASRLEPDKNPLLYLEAVKEISKKYPEIKFHLLGEGTLVYEIQRFIESNGLSGLVNFRFHNNPPEIFANTSVFISLQSNTNYPSQSILEAMACGNAIIASDVGDTRLFVNEQNGLLIQKNLESLISAIEYLYQNKDLAKKFGLAARQTAIKNHTIEKAAEYYIGLFNKAYAKHSNLN